MIQEGQILFDPLVAKGVHIMINIFKNPDKYLKYVDQLKISKELQKSFDGKSMTVVWLTKLCNGNCDHCFSKPPKEYDYKRLKEYQFTEFGVKRLINFINESNCAYLMISGGGEPMFYKKALFEIVEKAEAEKIVIVTNGVWGQDYRSAKDIIDELYQKILLRGKKSEIVIRISVDRFHEKSLGIDMIPNIFKVFKEHYSDVDGFRLMFHSIIDDPTMEKVASIIPNADLSPEEIYNSSDSETINKIIPRKKILRSGDYCVSVGYAKLFYPNFKANINEIDKGKLFEIFDDDIIKSENGNPALTFNNDGTIGLDFWIKYNGNVTTWGNQICNDYYSIYVNSYKEIKEKTIGNILSYSFLDKGYFYRENIINEINPHAVIRSKAVQLRNYSSAMLLEESSTKLYYGLRVIQDYISDGILETKDLSILPIEMQEMLAQSKNVLQSFYNAASYDIIEQYINATEQKGQKEWDMLFILIRNGHYCVSPDHIRKAMTYYNQRFKASISSIEEISDIKYDEFQERL